MKDVLGVGELSQNGIEIFKTLYPDIAQPAVRKVGIALETVFDFANTILLPLKLANDRSKVYFQKHMESYKEKINKVPDNEIGTVTPEVGLPILDELLRVTNDELAELFVNLLLNASTLKNSHVAHPSFINVIKSLSGDEARIIHFLSNYPKEYFLSLSFDRVDTNGQVVPLTGSYSNISSLVNLDYREKEQFYVKNLINLGLIEEFRNVYLESDFKEYDIIREAYKHIEESHLLGIRSVDKTNYISQSTISLSRGRNKLTPYGKEFIKSIKVPEVSNTTQE